MFINYNIINFSQVKLNVNEQNIGIRLGFTLDEQLWVWELMKYF